jgi:ferredoxin-NADP reductase
MDTPAVAPRSSPWQMSTVVAIKAETPGAKSYRLALAHAVGHRAGQHCVVRLTAPDGYRASRSYSIASAPDDDSPEFEITVERLEGGEVSSFLHDEVAVGDELEVRTPIGGWFVWDADSPALLIGGGSGVVPLMAMLRLARRLGRSDLLRLVVSVRTPDDLYYADEISGPETTLVYTRAAPAAFARPPGRLSPDDIPKPIDPAARAYICGSSGFADAAGDALMAAGVPTERIRVERFGPSG